MLFPSHDQFRLGFRLGFKVRVWFNKSSKFRSSFNNSIQQQHIYFLGDGILTLIFLDSRGRKVAPVLLATFRAVLLVFPYIWIEPLIELESTV